MRSLVAELAREATALLRSPVLAAEALPSRLRSQPGVYIALEKGKPVYVGMSSNLRRRVLHEHLGFREASSRLQDIVHDRERVPYGEAMARRMRTFTWRVRETGDTDSAVLLEAYVVVLLRRQGHTLWNRAATGAEGSAKAPALGSADVSRKAVLQAMKEHRLRHPRRQDDAWWLRHPSYRYVVWHGRRSYPPKQIWSVAAGIPLTRFRGGSQVNGWLRRLGFRVTSKPTARPEARAPSPRARARPRARAAPRTAPPAPRRRPPR